MADWDTFSNDYDRIFLESPFYKTTIERLTEQVESSVERVLDLGCGTGNISQHLLESFPAAIVVGLDPSEGMRNQFTERFEGRENVSAVEGSATDIPFGDDEFDCVVSNLALHHLSPDTRGVSAREIARVLRPGGLLLYADMFIDVDSDPRDPVRVKDIVEKIIGISMYCLDHGAYDMMMIMLRTLPADINADGEFLTTAETWMEELEAAGFVDFEVLGVPPVDFVIKIIRAVLA